MAIANMYFGDNNMRDVVCGYHMSALTGLIPGATTINSILFAMRNIAQAGTFGNQTRAVGISKLNVSVLGGITPFAAPASVAIAFFRASGFTALETGGTPVLAQKRKTPFLTIPATELDAQIATTTGLVAGTRTLEAQPFFVAAFGGEASFGGNVEWSPEDHIPQGLAGDEGIVAQLVAATPATGTMRLFVGFDLFRF